METKHHSFLFSFTQGFLFIPRMAHLHTMLSPSLHSPPLVPWSLHYEFHPPEGILSPLITFPKFILRASISPLSEFSKFTFSQNGNQKESWWGVREMREVTRHEKNVDIDALDRPASYAENGKESFVSLSRHGSDNSEGGRQPLLRNRPSQSSQLAIVGANVCPIESLDYEVFENQLVKQDLRARKRVEIFQYIFLKWVLALLIGLITGITGFLNNFGVENIAGFKFLQTSKLMNQDKHYLAFVLYAGCNLVLAVTAALLCAYIAPAAAGSGIPEVKAYLNGIDSYAILAPSTLLVKIFGSIFGVAAGFIVGKEGPMVHTGACIACLLGQGGSRKYGLTWKWLRYFKNDRDRRDLITCGAAAGVAAAFRAPVGGVLFALEEAASWWRSALLWRSFFTTAVVAVVLRTLMNYCRHGNCGLFGEGGLIMFDVNSATEKYSAGDLLAIIILGILGGVLGSLYNFCVDKVLRTYGVINELGPIFKVMLVAAISLLTSCCAYGLPFFAHCTPCPPHLNEKCPSFGHTGNYRSFACPPGQYNDLASLLLTTNDDAIRNLLMSSTEKEFHLSILFVAFIAMFCLGIVTYGIAIPSGLFIPVILAGSTYGRLLGTLLGSICQCDKGLLALLGAASFLGGTMRMTVSICVILLELTNNLLMLPFVMLVLLISKTVADCFNKGVYDQIVEMKGLPFLEAHPGPIMRHLVASDVVTGPLIMFSSLEKVGNIVQILRMTGHNGFPVIDEPPFSDVQQLCGLVLRSHILVLLKGKKFNRERELYGPQMLNSLKAFDFAKPGSGKGLKIEDVDIRDEEMEMYVDLHPITNTSPYTVAENMSLAKAADLFRELGLRHLCVVPHTPGSVPIVGILTRHDFMEEHIFAMYPNLRKHHG